MVDVDKIKKTTDLLALVGRDVKLIKVASTAGGEYAGECPFCGGRDRFRVQPEQGRWWCRQCGDRWQDAIGYIQKRHGVGFKEAAALLGDYEAPPLPARPAQPDADPVAEVDLARWREAGEQLVAEAVAALWSPDGDPVRRQLRESRGLDDESLRAFKVGYVTAERFDELPAWGLPPETNAETGRPRKVWLPRGVLIPCYIDGELRYIKVRRPDAELRGADDRKVVFVKGGHPALFNADALAGADVVLLVEGEFDAMLAHQAGRGHLAAGTLGSAQGRLDVDRWARYLLQARLVLVAYDADAAGSKGSEALARLSARVRRVRVPVLRLGDKDIVDYYRAGGDVRGWLEGALGVESAAGRVYERTKKAHGGAREASYQNDNLKTSQVLADKFGVSQPTILRDAQFARAVAPSLTVGEFIAGKTIDELHRILDVGDLLHHQERELYALARQELARREAADEKKTSRPLF